MATAASARDAVIAAVDAVSVDRLPLDPWPPATRLSKALRELCDLFSSDKHVSTCLVVAIDAVLDKICGCDTAAKPRPSVTLEHVDILRCCGPPPTRDEVVAAATSAAIYLNSRTPNFYILKTATQRAIDIALTAVPGDMDRDERYFGIEWVERGFAKRESSPLALAARILLAGAMTVRPAKVLTVSEGGTGLWTEYDEACVNHWRDAIQQTQSRRKSKP